MGRGNGLSKAWEESKVERLENLEQMNEARMLYFNLGAGVTGGGGYDAGIAGS